MPLEPLPNPTRRTRSYAFRVFISDLMMDRALECDRAAGEDNRPATRHSVSDGYSRNGKIIYTTGTAGDDR